MVRKNKIRLGIVWWYDACETVEQGKITKKEDLPVVQTAGIIVEYDEVIEVAHSIHTNPDYRRQNTVTAIPKGWLKNIRYVNIIVNE